MAAFNRHPLVLVTILALCVIFGSSLPSVTSRPVGKADLLHKTCQTAGTRFKGKLVTSARCLSLLSSDPRASKAKTIKELAIVGLELAVKNATGFTARVNADIASKTTNPGLKAVLKNIVDPVSRVSSAFSSALGEIKEYDEFETANYDLFQTSDHIQAAREALAKASGKVDPFYAKGLTDLADYALVGYIITY